MKIKQCIKILGIMYFEGKERKKEGNYQYWTLTVCLALCPVLLWFYSISQGRNFCLYFVIRKLKIKRTSLPKGTYDRKWEIWLFCFSPLYHTVSRNWNTCPGMFILFQSRQTMFLCSSDSPALAVCWNHSESFNKYRCLQGWLS